MPQPQSERIILLTLSLVVIIICPHIYTSKDEGSANGIVVQGISKYIHIVQGGFFRPPPIDSCYLVLT